VTAWLAVRVTVHGPETFAHAPDQPLKVDPGSAAAESVTVVPAGKDAWHVVPHEMPEGAEVTVPAPPPALPTASTGRHAPASHTSPRLQALPQAPQWSSLVWRFTQSPPHEVEGAEQLPTHDPPEQTSPRPQGLPHPPQFARSDWGFTQAPPQFR
jgi:hypothetical protein